MPCPKGGDHQYEPEIIDGETCLVCQKCEHVGRQVISTQQELLEEVERLKKVIDELEAHIERMGLPPCSYD